LEVEKGRRKPNSPLKFNPEWLKEESFIDLVKEQWVPFDPNSEDDVAVQFVCNLKKVK